VARVAERTRRGKHIAVAGKGGTGKTTLAALLIRCLLEAGRGPILAVDADPNANLGEVLGLDDGLTIAALLEETKDPAAIPAGMSRDAFIEYRLNAARVESTGVDLLVMGGPEGPGCYCYPNDLLRKHMESLCSGYRYLVMDNEAGLEHLSRRVARDVDVFIVTSDATVRGVRSAGRIAALARSLKLDVGEVHLVLCRAGEDEAQALQPEVARTGLDLGGVVPADAAVAAFDLQGKPLSGLPGSSPALLAVRGIVTRLLI